VDNLLAILGVLSPIGLVVLGWFTFKANQRMNDALEKKALADAERSETSTAKMDAETESLYQRLYSEAKEELERSVTATNACKTQIEALTAEVSDLKKDNIVLKAEVIRLGGDPELLGLRRNGRDQRKRGR
jgi:hypothetical protein